MPIILEVFGPDEANEILRHSRTIYIWHLTPKDKPRIFDPSFAEHIVCITSMHPILLELEQPERGFPSTSRCPTEIAWGTGIGGSFKEHRVTTFKDLATLMRAYWDLHDIGPKALEMSERQLEEREKNIGHSAMEKVKGLPEMIRIAMERKAIQRDYRLYGNYVLRAQGCLYKDHSFDIGPYYGYRDGISDIQAGIRKRQLRMKS